jgi:hypothetical protein
MGKQAKKTKKKPAPETPFVVTSLGEYKVAGGVAFDEAARGTSRIDLVGEKLGGKMHRGVSLFIPRDELGFYPLGAKVRVKVERG